MGQIVSSAAKPKRCNANQLSQVPTPAAGEHILVSSDNSMNAAGQGNFDCYIVGDGTTAANGLERVWIDNVPKQQSEVIISDIYDGSISGYVAASNNKIYTGQSTLRYKLFSKDTIIHYNLQTKYGSVSTLGSIPAANKAVTPIAVNPSTAQGTSGTALISAGRYLVWDYAVEITVTSSSNPIPVDVDDWNTLILKDTKSALYIDGLLPIGFYRNFSPDIIDVVSATADTITVSSASNSSACLVAVKHSTNYYTVHVFTITSNVLTIVRRAGLDDDVDLSDAVKIQGVYNTENSGMGQHLSAFGYLAYANYIVNALAKRDAFLQDNYVGGFIFTSQGINSSPQNNGFLMKADGTLLYKPIYKNCTFSSPNYAYVYQDNTYNDVIDCFLRHYKFIQSTEGASVEFVVSEHGIGNGYIVVRGCTSTQSSSTGSARMDVLVNNEVVYSQTMPSPIVGKIVVDNLDLRGKVSVKFTTLSANKTTLILQSICLYSAPSAKKLPVFSSDIKIAVIGDSWTQFPTSSDIVESDNTYNTVDTLANGQQAGGYCYLPKELAKLTGCTVDNYGKSNMTSVYGLQQLAQNILAQGKHYDYILLEYYINDKTDSSLSNAQWKANIEQLLKMCKAMNARPIIMGTTATNSVNQATALADMGSLLLTGFDL